MRTTGLEKAVKKFWANMVQTPEGHWLWQGKGRTGSLGYGAIKLPLALGLGRKNESAHRFAFYLARGFWPENARHTCDIPLCCNPDHLLEGTPLQNTQDCAHRGRLRNGNIKLNPAIWQAIRKSNEPTRILADRYGVTLHHLRNIKQGLSGLFYRPKGVQQ